MDRRAGTGVASTLRSHTRRGHMKKTFLVAIGLALAVPAFAHDNHGGKPKPVACGELTGLRLEDTTITLGQLLPAGANPNPVGTIALPICRVVGVTEPAVQFEVWLPSSGWNGKFQ